jgi:hypothetical protein
MRADSWSTIVVGDQKDVLLTVLDLEKVLNKILHESVLLSDVALEVDHFGEDVLVISLEITDVGGHVLLCLDKAVDLSLESLYGGGVARCGRGGKGTGRGGYSAILCSVGGWVR